MRGFAQALAAFTVLSGAAASAAPLPALDVPTLAGEAAGVATGRVTAAAVAEQRDGTAHEVLTVSVDRWLKAPAGTTVRTITIDLAEGTPGVSAGQYATFYLAIEPGNAHLRPANAARFMTPASPRLPHPMAAGDPLAAIAQELTNVFDTPQATLSSLSRASGRTVQISLPDPFVAAPTESARPVLVASGAVTQVQALYNDAMDALATLPAVLSHASLRRLSGSADPLVQLWATIGLLRQDDWSGVAQSRALLVDAPGPVAPSLSAAAEALTAARKSAEQVPVLTALLASRAIDIRRAAAAGLGDIATPEVVRPLGQVGLRDSDRMVRYYAVTGLAAATGEGEAPATDTFTAGEAGYLGFWSGWLKQHAVN